ncbi:hypothetical protein HanPI659440_Chr02g0081611 [Helianthus annuus]|nr:hypothetical protein HanIR_Chr02g0083971 [Helianthus annuus]KAJ0805728.1 hypothetical protein HanPI659440_Chr02g0081611 [Helianthus annuus]
MTPGNVKFPLNFSFSPYFCETRTYSGFTFRKYFRIVSFENLLSSNDSEHVSFSCCRFFEGFELFRLLNFTVIELPLASVQIPELQHHNSKLCG